MFVFASDFDFVRVSGLADAGMYTTPAADPNEHVRCKTLSHDPLWMLLLTNSASKATAALEYVLRKSEKANTAQRKGELDHYRRLVNVFEPRMKETFQIIFQIRMMKLRPSPISLGANWKMKNRLDK